MKTRAAIAAAVAAVLSVLGVLHAQAGRAPDVSNRPADWPMYNRDLAGTRYSPLTQINRQNIARLIGLDAGTGRPAASFGTKGHVDIGAPYESAPTLYKNLLILGTNGPPGGVRAFDARTGAKVWEFQSVPQSGQVGVETWSGESWRNREGTYSWAFSMTVDAERATVYAAVEAPGPSDYWVADRPGSGVVSMSPVSRESSMTRPNVSWPRR